jgi:hypothetical protein
MMAPCTPDVRDALRALAFQLRWSWNAIFADGENEHSELLRNALEKADAALREEPKRPVP